MRVLVTGASGFIGSATCEALAAAGHQVLGGTRAPALQPATTTVEWVAIPELGPSAEWGGVLEGAEVVVHLAARAHVLREEAADPQAEYQRVNAEGTGTLARAAAAAGVRRLVFLSTIGVNGRASGEQPFTEASAPDPTTPYARSKWAAENLLRDCGLDVVVIRAPLVYGPHAPGNFGRLVRWVLAGRPLPLGLVDNRRSLVGVRNLASLISRVLDADQAAGQLLLVSDGEDVSTRALVQRIARAAGRPDRLLPVPVMPMRLVARMVGRGDMLEQLAGTLLVDSSKARELLAWEPAVSLDDELARVVGEALRG